MSVTHTHSSPSHSAMAWGVWAFQDAFDFRFFDYYARQNAKAIVKAYRNMHKVRVSATVSNFDAFQRNPMGPGRGNDGTPVGFPRSRTGREAKKDERVEIVIEDRWGNHSGAADLVG